MDIWESVSKQDLERGIRILARASADNMSSIIIQGVCIFLKVLSYRSKGKDTSRIKFTSEEKVELMEAINKLETINDSVKLFLASLCRE